MTVDVPDWMPESQQFLNAYLGVTTQIAALIATGNPAGNPGGVPLLTLNNLLDKQVNQTIANGQQYLSNNLVINQPSYDFTLSMTYPAGTTAPFVMVRMVWTDSAMGTGFLTEEDWFFAGGANGICEYGGRGLTKGDTLNVYIINLDTAHTVTYTYAITQHSRIVPRDDIRSTIFNQPNNFQVGPSDLKSNILLMWEPTVNAGTTSTLILPLFAGQVQVATIGEANSQEILIRAAAAVADPNAIIVNTALLTSGTIAANVPFSQYVTLPRMPCTLSLTNHGAANQVYLVSVLAQEY